MRARAEWGSSCPFCALFLVREVSEVGPRELLPDGEIGISLVFEPQVAIDEDEDALAEVRVLAQPFQSFGRGGEVQIGIPLLARRGSACESW